MQVNFHNQTNDDIDHLVNLCWNLRASHDNELFLIPEREEEDLIEFINDEIENNDDGIGEQEEALPASIDLSKFSARVIIKSCGLANKKRVAYSRR